MENEKMVNTNVLYCGDCLNILKGFPDECIDLIYIDPPFFSNKHYEVIWGNGAELRAFGDRWKGGINHYIGWMKERLEQCKRVLKKTGSIYLHCDWHANHHLRIVMDDLFGYENFRNEIIWCYKTRHFSKKHFGRKHDNILFYTKSANYTFNWEANLRPLSEVTIKKFKYKDEKGFYRLVGRGIKGSPIQSAKDVDPKWEKTHPELVTRSYLKEGIPIEDYWEIEIINQASNERLGYPTQKPEALLDKIIKASSNPKNIVLDPMMGGGTTLAVAQKLERQWIGIDVSPIACKVTQKRLRQLGVNAIVLGLPKSVDELKKLEHFEFQNWVCKQLNGKMSDRKSSDMGIDGWILGTIPIQVKQSEDVGRNAIDNFAWALQRAKKKKGVFVAFSYGKGAFEEAARAKLQNDVEIKLITIDDMLKADFNPMALFS